MINPLIEQLEGMRALVILTEAAIHGAEVTADKLAAALVDQCREIERAKKSHAEVKARLVVLELAAKTSSIQGALRARNESPRLEYLA